MAGLAALPAIIRKLPAATAARLTGESPLFGAPGPVSGLPDGLRDALAARPDADGDDAAART